MNVGGASGPLYGTAFMEIGKNLNENTTLDIETIEKCLNVAVLAIQKRGRSQKGDKTMLDSLIPIDESLKKSAAEKISLADALDSAMTAAREGVEFTKTIAAKKGRASYLGERSIGTEDPGAVSSLIIFRAFCQFLKDNDLI